MLVRYCTAVALKRHERVNAFNLVMFKNCKFIKLCKGDKSRRPKTAKINLGRNRHVRHVHGEKSMLLRVTFN